VRSAVRSSSASLRAGQAGKMPSLDIIMASSSVPRPIRRRGVSQSSRFVQAEVKQADRPGKLGRLVPGAQSERPKKER
jgi:hypothetical protein